MTVERAELKCWEYVYLIKDIEKFPMGLYGLNQMRTTLHDEICDLMKLNKEDTFQYTDNLDKINYNGSELYLQLLLLSRKEQC